ncbi:MAG TPA: class I SAM-dependent methyltransferase [Polyangiaceae bacterium]|nr:class I SAM-dependent methyltransferase [Polyangiaceae bacterium]
MSARSIGLTDDVWRYLLDVTVHEPPLLGRLRAETAKLSEAGMQISPEQGRFLAFLVEVLGVKRYLEVGVFTGYSSLSVALALPADGRIVACDVSDEWTRVARRYWQEAGVADKVELKLGPGVETLASLVAAGERFDFAFFDADKESSLAYYERGLELVRQGGVLAFDNALWNGSVADPKNEKPSTAAIRAVNARVCSDPRVSATLVPIGDGVLLARKR